MVTIVSSQAADGFQRFPGELELPYLAGGQPADPNCQSDQALDALWGKTCGQKTDQVSASPTSLFTHCQDVAQATRRLWEQTLAPGARALLARLLHTEEAAAGGWLSLLAGLHDLGKATPGFQSRTPAGRRAAQAVGLSLPRGARTDHTLTGLFVLRDLLSAWGVCQGAAAVAVAAAVARHHGRPEALPVIRPGRRDLGDERWEALRLRLAARLAEASGVDLTEPPPGLRAPAPELLALLGGLVRIADWEASRGGNGEAGLGNRPGTRHDLQELAGVADSPLSPGTSTVECYTPGTAGFGTLFGFPPNALQRRLISLCDGHAAPRLVLIEAPTGEGKTEAALWLARALEKSGQRRGLFMAMPTRASAEVMRGRLEALGMGTVALVRGGLGDHEGPASLGLCAPVAVGTVDQALLGVLADRQSWVRLLGLANKTVVFDEVHAYEAYTSGVLGALLSWLGRLQCTVVLLSATLAREQREELLLACGAPPGENSNYPRITVGREQAAGSHSYLSPQQRVIGLRHIPSDDLAPRLAERLAGGGCALCLCNTVEQAQQRYLHLREALGATGVEVRLLHARYPAGERGRRVAETIRRFAKNGERPRRAVLVATQIAEQSLDLDFDLLVTEWAPVDCLLQRAGRLYRHQRTRPARLARPEMWLLQPPRHADGRPDFGNSVFVYHEALLLRTWLAWQGQDTVHLPRQTDDLIEAVYGEASPPCPRAWRRRLHELQADLGHQRDLARRLAAVASAAEPISSGTLLPLAATLTRHPQTHLGECPEVRVLPVYGPPEARCLDAALTVPVAEGDATAHAVTIRSRRLHQALAGRGSGETVRLALDERGCWEDGEIEVRFEAELGAVLSCVEGRRRGSAPTTPPGARPPDPVFLGDNP